MNEYVWQQVKILAGRREHLFFSRQRQAAKNHTTKTVKIVVVAKE